MKILIADDHSLFVEGLKSILEAKGYTIIGIANNGLQALDMVKKEKPDLIFMDVNMPGCNGIESTILIHKEYPDVSIIILTASEEEEDMKLAMKHGAIGYLLKTFKAEVLFEILSAIEMGVKPRFPNISIKKEKAVSKRKDKETYGLTRRQIEVINLVSQGYFYKEIGQQLGISERTVKYHVESAINKLKVSNKQELIKYAIKLNII